MCSILLRETRRKLPPCRASSVPTIDLERTADEAPTQRRKPGPKKDVEVCSTSVAAPPSQGALESSAAVVETRDFTEVPQAAGRPISSVHGNHHHQGRHADLLQGLGEGTAGRLQPRLASQRGRLRRPDVLLVLARLS